MTTTQEPLLQGLHFSPSASPVATCSANTHLPSDTVSNSIHCKTPSLECLFAGDLAPLCASAVSLASFSARVSARIRGRKLKRAGATWQRGRGGLVVVLWTKRDPWGRRSDVTEKGANFFPFYHEIG